MITDLLVVYIVDVENSVENSEDPSYDIVAAILRDSADHTEVS
jgi:hypothetical protein